MSIFTLYCHGTGSHRSRRDGEIVTHFSGHTLGDFYVLDGPGMPDTKDKTGQLDHEKPGELSVERHPIPGTYNPFTAGVGKTLKTDRDAEFRDLMKVAETLSGDKNRVDAIKEAQRINIEKEKGRRKFADRALDNMGYAPNNPLEKVTFQRNQEGEVGVKTKYYREYKGRSFGYRAPTKGTLTGFGWDDNIAEAIAVLLECGIDEGRIQGINMLGWSRGAVTCLRIANRLFDMGVKNIPVNIFAVDPVAAQDAGLRLEDTRRIPPTVKHYLATLAMDEQREGFLPQDLSRVQVMSQEASNVIFLPFPGKHNTQVRLDNPGLNQAAKVVWNLAYCFLTHLGTKLRAGCVELVSPDKMINRYSKMLLNRPGYHDLRNRGLKQRVQGGLGGRPFTGMDEALHHTCHPKLSVYVTDPQCFMNIHHRTLFKHRYWNIYDWFFQPGSGEGKITPDPIAAELKDMYDHAPATLELLQRVGLFVGGDGKVALPQRGAGMARQEMALNPLLKGINLLAMGIPDR